MGLDYGPKTVGVAISDELLITSQGKEIIRRNEENKLRRTLARIEELINEYGVEKIVLGLPLNMDDSVSERSKLCLEFKDRIERRTGIPVEMQDERLTTVEADEIMDEAERAVVGMVMSDAKDKLDEKLREEQEKAEEKKEEEEKQEKIEAQREEKKEIQEALTEGSREAVQEARERSRQREGNDLDLTDVMGSDPTAMLEKTSNVNAQLDDLKNKMALIDADLKGLKVDETV
jgi:putative Holliday junction resolvase